MHSRVSFVVQFFGNFCIRNYRLFFFHQAAHVIIVNVVQIMQWAVWLLIVLNYDRAKRKKVLNKSSILSFLIC